MEEEITKNTINQPARREFFKKTWKILGLVFVVEIIFFISSMFRSSRISDQSHKKDNWKILGNVEDFIPGSVTPFRIHKLFLIRRKEDKGFLAVSLICSHLGCSVVWDDEFNKFQCPCHSSTFDEVGNVLNSPASSALDYYPVFIEGGKVQVDTAHKIKRKRFEKSQLTYAS